MAGGTKFVGAFDVSAMSPEKFQMLREAVGFTVRSNVWTLVINVFDETYNLEFPARRSPVR